MLLLIKLPTGSMRLTRFAQYYQLVGYCFYISFPHLPRLRSDRQTDRQTDENVANSNFMW